jgi:hypothetical protein
LSGADIHITDEDENTISKEAQCSQSSDKGACSNQQVSLGRCSNSKLPRMQQATMVPGMDCLKQSCDEINGKHGEDNDQEKQLQENGDVPEIKKNVVEQNILEK